MKVVSVVGKKKSGKTTMIERLIPLLKVRGKVATIKNLPPQASVDKKGTDTWRHRDAGADVIVGITPESTYTVNTKALSLTDVLAELRNNGVDYVLVEGFRDSDLQKIVIDDLAVTNRLDLDVGDMELEDIVNVIDRLEEWEP